MAQRQKGKTSLIRILLSGTIGISLLTILLVVLLLSFQSSTLLARSLEKELDGYSQSLMDAFSSLIESYEQLADEISSDPALIEAVHTDGFSGSATLYQALHRCMDGCSINPIVHLVSADQSTAVSTGFGAQRYNPRNYAGIGSLLDQSDDAILAVPRHFQSASGEEIVLTFAKKFLISDDLGYIYLDMAKGEIDACIDSACYPEFYNQDSGLNYIIYNWYNYIIYNTSNLSEITSGTSYIKNDFAAQFSEKSKAISYTDKNVEYLLSSAKTDSYTIVCAIPLSLLMHGNHHIIIIAFIFAVVILLVCFLFAYRVNCSILDPVQNILQTMTRLGNGDLTVRCQFHSKNELALIRDQLNQLIEDINCMIQTNEEKQKQLMLAEDNILKTQIKPHFINNVLESIRWTIQMGDIDAASNALQLLGRMLTDCIGYYDLDFETLSRSLDFTKRYIAIQQFCYPDKIHASFRFPPDTLSVKLPTFLLQPIVENAILHGLQPKLGPGMLCLSAERTNGFLKIQVQDNGIGMPLSVLEHLFDPPSGTHGIGLYNVHRRLELSYGRGLHIASSPGQGTTVSLEIPISE